LNTPHLNRRRFLALSGGAVAFTAACTKSGPGAVASSPSTISATDPIVGQLEAGRTTAGAPVVSRSLTAAPVTLDFAGRQAQTWAYGAAAGGPEIRAAVGDVLEVKLANGLPEETTIHWHGLALRNDMDGVHDLTQAAIAPGGAFTYRFALAHPGTYWFHPHMGLQLDRGLYAPLIIEDPNEKGSADIDQVIVLDDWLDGISGTPDDALKKLTAADMSGMDMGGGSGMGGMAMARSDALGGDAGDVSYPFHLINGRPPEDRSTFVVAPGAKVRLRVINAGSDTAYRFAVGGHRLTVTHTDGYPVQPIEVDTILLGMGERYDVVVQAKSGAWPIVAVAEGKGQAASAVLRTTDATATSAPDLSARPAELDGQMLSLADLKATEAVALAAADPDMTTALELTGSMAGYTWGINGKAFADADPIVVEQGQRVRLTMHNATTMFHPMHLHGHTFRVGTAADGPRKDTVIVKPDETVSVDFVADNPGRWMFHCHNTYHLEAGMAAPVGYRASA
jgi:FtsP/CotA-like multicopper oxidase with cupredoxin domain